jgi:hypothetical protein
VQLIVAATAQIVAVQTEMNTRFDRHPTAAVVRSQPGLAKVLSARVLAEFGDDPERYASAEARKNYADTSPITRQSCVPQFMGASSTRIAVLTCGNACWGVLCVCY